jgi:Tol biopolymer transport system component
MPDGKHVIFTSAAGDPAIWWTRADGSGQPQRLLAPKAELFTNSVSPDGRRVAFAQRDPQSGLDLWTLPLDTSDPEHPKPGVPEPFLREEGNQTNPMFSPDGRWIAYCSNQAGIQQVFVRPFAGSSSGSGGKWQVSTTGGSNPVWSRDGKTLFYRGSTPQLIFKVKYTAAGNSFVPGKAEAWSPKSVWASDTWTFDMSPEGARAVMLPLPDRRDIPAGTVHVTVLLNFFDELKRRVP